MRFFIQTLFMAAHALRRNIMRSILTTLGIIIGVGAVIAMVAIGQGASKAVQATIQSMGSNIVLVMAGSSIGGSVSGGQGTAVTLSIQDAEALADSQHFPSIVGVAPMIRSRAQVVYNNKNWSPFDFYGTTPNYLELKDWEDLAEGRCFTKQDNESLREVCVLGQTVVRELFNGESPLGEQVRINNRPVTVIGVLKRKGASMMGSDQDDTILVPWMTLKYKISDRGYSSQLQAGAKADLPPQATPTNQPYPTTDLQLVPAKTTASLMNTPQLVRFANIDRIMLKIDETDNIQPTITQVTESLRERHRIPPEQAGEDFYVRDMTELSKALGSTSGQMAWLLLVVATISLVVGGVGIMNIMLVSVTERTREIGLRMAVGARARDILRQFLVESSLLCLMGGVIGILLGWLGSWIVHLTKGWATEVSIPVVFAAVGVSVAVGIIFGFYPAWKASRLDPIEALRYE
jgi:ABC-type antimicrobial peptide transport system permease subunit